MKAYCGKSAHSKCRRPSSARKELVLDKATLKEKWCRLVRQRDQASCLTFATFAASLQDGDLVEQFARRNLHEDDFHVGLTCRLRGRTTWDSSAPAARATGRARPPDRALPGGRAWRS
jgi:hypothetical protein